MQPITVEEVRPRGAGRRATLRGRATLRAFHTFPWSIYRDDPIWVPPLLPDRMKASDPRRGPFFARGEAAFFVARRAGRIVGTICAARDQRLTEDLGRPECVFGFFESVDDPAVAAALFDRAEEWAAERGLSSLIGPFNLDYEDGYGVLTDGRDRKPAILCGHSPAYYQRLFEELGFCPARPGNIALAIDLADPPPELERLRRAADIARRRGGYRIRTVNVREWRREAVHVHYLLNHSLEENGQDAVPWPLEAVESLLRPFLKIADPDLILFVERDPARGPDPGRPVGWFAGVPNMNEVIDRANGLRYPWNYLQLLANLRRRPTGFAAKSLLVLPEYHASGAAALLFDEMARRLVAKGYSWVDLSLTSEGNPQTPILAARAGAVRYKRYQVYRREIATA